MAEEKPTLRELIEPAIDRSVARIREHLEDDPGPALLLAIVQSWEDAFDAGYKVAWLDLQARARAQGADVPAFEAPALLGGRRSDPPMNPERED